MYKQNSLKNCKSILLSPARSFSSTANIKQIIITRKQNSMVKVLQNQLQSNYVSSNLSQCSQQEDIYDLQIMPVIFDLQHIDSIKSELNQTVELELVINDLKQGDTSYILQQLRKNNQDLRNMMIKCVQLNDSYDQISNILNRNIQTSKLV
ncbi:Hypothetical_protein [Hexamita inflata]|uniref:Hypothetical_protein n=1 Tax=Hexamita inflata TaxID=28002 RepID=A0AA86QAR4_9EUKA|nr:Hypothetical protein HINF_LOCUS43176 [Hexamita inflata]